MMNMGTSYLGWVTPQVGIVLILAGLIYGLLGWRLVRYLAVADAIGVACFMGVVLSELNMRGSLNVPSLPLTGLLLIGLPWIAWRCGRWSVIAMGGLVGFAGTQLLINSWDMPVPVRLLIGCLASAFVMAMHFTLYRNSAIVVTSIHGGWMLLVGLSAMLTGSIGGNFMIALRSYELLPPVMILIFTVTMMHVQWADLERTSDPF